MTRLCNGSKRRKAATVSGAASSSRRAANRIAADDDLEHATTLGDRRALVDPPPEQRPLLLGHSVTFPSGIAFVSTACSSIAADWALICAGVSRTTPFGAVENDSSVGCAE